MEWERLNQEQRAEAYRARQVEMSEVIEQAREHRESGDCILAPLCPGRDAAEHLMRINPFDPSEVMASLTAFAVDQAIAIASLRKEADGWAKRTAEAERERATADDALAAALRDAEAGWAAYRAEVLLRKRESGDGE